MFWIESEVSILLAILFVRSSFCCDQWPLSAKCTQKTGHDQFCRHHK